MRRKAILLLMATALSCSPTLADETGSTAPSRHVTLREAVQLALKHNHNVRIADYAVDAKQHAKEAAKGSYFPSIRNDSSFLRVTDTQLIQINPGSLGTAGGTPIPPASSVINQGGRSLTASGTQITQPLTLLLKIKLANDIAQAEVEVSRSLALLLVILFRSLRHQGWRDLRWLDRGALLHGGGTFPFDRQWGRSYFPAISQEPLLQKAPAGAPPYLRMTRIGLLVCDSV